MKRRTLLQAALAGTLGIHLAASAATSTIEVYKNPYCSCCTEWVKHLQQNGFTVNTHEVEDTSEHRKKFGMPEALGSCHTGTIQGYALEGHVPAAEIKRLLAEKPKAVGLSVPGMPIGSPGMEGARKDSFDVLLVQQNGKHSIYKHYKGQ
jgi:hypothetical protein